MSEDFWQTTAQMFGSLFDKPKMTEKLLLKPPFKYLFDIVIQTINVSILFIQSFPYLYQSTGFGKNLYTKDELSADFYDTKEKKMYFLRKIILLIGNMLQEEVEAKPNKIVAGVEPDKTNYFLQCNLKYCYLAKTRNSAVQSCSEWRGQWTTCEEGKKRIIMACEY